VQISSSRAAVLSIGCVTLLICNLGLAPRPPVAQPLWELVDSPTYPDRARAAQQPWFIREQKIRFHPQPLQSLRDLSAPPTSTVAVDLIGAITHELVIHSRTAGALSSTVVQGRLQQGLQGDATLVIKDTVVAGTMHVDKQTFKIEYVGNGEHLLVEIDPEKLPPD
jgi:hypothetical protein